MTSGDMPSTHPELDELISVLARLRAPGGCAWDREQSHESLVKHLVEETYELVDAIESGSRDELIEELGDVLYQVLFHADIGASRPDDPFDIDDVAARTTAKMIGRHPQVFAAPSPSQSPSQTGASAGEVEAAWEDLKAAEKPSRSSALDGIPRGLPSLQLADKLLSRAERVGAAVPAPAARTDRVGASLDEAEQIGRAHV